MISVLENLRKSHSFSQQYLAEKLGVSRPTYKILESGEKALTIDQVKTLSLLYSIDPKTFSSEGGSSVVTITDTHVVEAELPTDFGNFIIGVWPMESGKEVVYIRTKNINTQSPALVRVHSECLTGDVFHSLRCDCGEQKDLALKMIADYGNGVLIYLRQEGRGIGLYEKIKAYNLQEKGYDTHEANILLGHKPDYREYSWAKRTLDYLGIQSIKLLTNNPSKVSGLSQYGIHIVERVALYVDEKESARKYFETKKSKFKHFFGKDDASYYYQFCYAQTPEQIINIGDFVKTLPRDPYLKICVGVYANAHTLSDPYEISRITELFATAELYESFVPILHYSFVHSFDPKSDIRIIREKMSFVKYVQLDDLNVDFVETVLFANKFFLTDIPFNNKTFTHLENSELVDSIRESKSFVLIDNSMGKGIGDTYMNYVEKISHLLSLGINDIAICGGFGPGSLDTYRQVVDHFKFNISIDAESKLQTNENLDCAKVKDYLKELISSKTYTEKNDITIDQLKQFKDVFCDEVSFITNLVSDKRIQKYLTGTILDVGSGNGKILTQVASDSTVLHLDTLPFQDPVAMGHKRIQGSFHDHDLLRTLPKIETLFLSHVMQYLDSDMPAVNESIELLKPKNIIVVQDCNDDFLGEIMRFSLAEFPDANPEVIIPDFPVGYKRQYVAPFVATVRADTMHDLALQSMYLMDLPITNENFKKMLAFQTAHLTHPEYTINQEIVVYVRGAIH
jgi:GTP cyclohydrolase II